MDSRHFMALSSYDSTLSCVKSSKKTQVYLTGDSTLDDRAIVVFATDARINERLVARGMEPMPGPRLTDILQEATGEIIDSRDALRQWQPDRLAHDPRVRAVIERYVSAA